jgi:O-antigen ligase
MLTAPANGSHRLVPTAARAGSGRRAEYYDVPAIVRWSFLAFVGAMPLEAVDLPFTSSSLAKLAGLLFIACYFFFYNPISGKRPFPAGSAALSFFLIYLFVFTVNGLFLERHHFTQFVSILLTLSQLLLLFWISSGVLRVQPLARRALLAFALGGVICAGGALLEVPGFATVIESRVGERMTALEFNPNYVAYLMAIAVMILIGAALEIEERVSWTKAALITLTLPLLALLVRSGSRTGLVVFAIGFGAYVCSSRGRAGKLRPALFIAVFLSITLIYLVLHNPTVLTRFEQSYGGNLAGRQTIIPASIDMILERPVFGWQPVAYWEELARRVGQLWSAKDAHNLFFHLLLEVGLLGAVPYVIGLWLCLAGAWKARTGKFGNLPFVLLVMTLMVNLSHTYLARKPHWLILALAVAAGARASQRSMAARYLIRHPLHANGRALGYPASARPRQL